ncbi:MAG: response regulator transcription factor [Thiotrichaceae bacterium]|nr:response regulator transcription factor [Thiotrichaceae bacterium]
MHILIAEDDPLIRQGLTDLLTQEGYQVTGAEDGKVALAQYQQHKPQLIILDIMMPELDGYSVCRAIRKNDEQIPIIFLSAKSEEIDRVIGLEMGADDYISKPFGIREVVARIRAVRRRYLASQVSTVEVSHFKLGHWMIFPNQLRAKTNDGLNSVDLSLREVCILKQLSNHPETVIHRDRLFDHCWGYDHSPNSRTLDQHIAKLRKRLEPDPKQPQWIITVHGVGYRYEP